MTSHGYSTIDQHVADLIQHLHKRHPNLGHHGLLQALEDEGVEVDPQDLERFMEQEDIEAEHWQFRPNSIKRHFRIAQLNFPDIVEDDMKGG